MRRIIFIIGMTLGMCFLLVCKGTGKERHLVGSVDTLVDVRQFKQAHGGFLHAGLHRRYVAD